MAHTVEVGKVVTSQQIAEAILQGRLCKACGGTTTMQLYSVQPDKVRVYKHFCTTCDQVAKRTTVKIKPESAM